MKIPKLLTIFSFFALPLFAGTLFAAAGTDSPENPPEISQGMGGSGPSEIKPGAKSYKADFVDPLEKLPIEEQIKFVTTKFATVDDGIVSLQKHGEAVAFFDEYILRKIVYKRCSSLEMKAQIIASVTQRILPTKEFQKLRDAEFATKQNGGGNANLEQTAKFEQQNRYRQFLYFSLRDLLQNFAENRSQLSAAEMLEIYDQCGFESFLGKLSNNLKNSKIEEKLLEEIRKLETSRERENP